MIKNIEDVNNTKNKCDLISTYTNSYPFIQNKDLKKHTDNLQKWNRT